jgi:hypothetical protein
MFERVQRRVALSELQVQVLLCGAALTSFGGLLFQDRVHPVAIYLLQLFLTF